MKSRMLNPDNIMNYSCSFLCKKAMAFLLNSFSNAIISIINLPAAETAGYLKNNTIILSFPDLIGESRKSTGLSGQAG